MWVYSSGYLTHASCAGHRWMRETSLSISLSLFTSSISRFFSPRKTKKNAAAIATESKGRPGPGLSPLEHPDWSRPAVWALLPCGRRGRQFSQRCRGRRAISAVLSGWIYTAGSKLIFFFHPCDTFCGWITGNHSRTVHINIGEKDLLTYWVFIDMGNVRDVFKVVENQMAFSLSFHMKSNVLWHKWKRQSRACSLCTYEWKSTFIIIREVSFLRPHYIYRR